MFTGLESPTHLLIILMVILLFFGGKRILELAKGLEEGNETHDEEERERQSGTGESNTRQGHSSST